MRLMVYAGYLWVLNIKEIILKIILVLIPSQILLFALQLTLASLNGVKAGISCIKMTRIV
jgi:hypothetical protein